MSVLARYDLRGIQSYIFRTPRLREIRAVGNLPEQLVLRALQQSAETLTGASASVAFGEIRILDSAGGNAVAVFPDEALCRAVSRSMAMQILRETRTLQLVYAWVPCTEDFAADYRALTGLLAKKKSAAPAVWHTGAFPVCVRDLFTGAPAAGLTPEGVPADAGTLGRLDEAVCGSSPEDCAGENGWLAVVHIDGNGMGGRIARMIGERGVPYSQAAALFSRITVREAFAQICAETEAAFPEIPFSRLIQAGDDITYLLPAAQALPFVQRFLEHASAHTMLRDGGRESLISACAGIAYCTARYPFAEAYETAEHLCMIAKERSARHPSKDGTTGSYLDFAVCTGTRTADVAAYRARLGPELFRRPYCVETPQHRDRTYSIDRLNRQLSGLIGEEPTMSRTEAAALRRAYLSRTAEERFYKNGIADLFDALELAAVLAD